LWRYRLNDSTWTWIAGDKGVNVYGKYSVRLLPTTNYYPGGRECAVAWYDSDKQEFWVFGGFGLGLGVLLAQGLLHKSLS